MSLSEKLCPFCVEPIKVEAIRCKHCQADLKPKIVIPDGAKLKSDAKKGVPGWAWIIIVPLALIVLMMGVGSREPTEQDNAMGAIELCWKDVDDPLASISARKVMRDVCRNLVGKYEAQYGGATTLRKD